MTGAMPIPSDTTQTNVNARAFASDRLAYTRSRQMPLNISTIQSRIPLLRKVVMSAGPFFLELAYEPRYREIVARPGLPLRIQGCGECCRNVRARTDASWRVDTADRSSTPVWDSRHARSPQSVLRSDVTARDSLFVAGTREGGVRKRPQPTSETPVAIRTLIWLAVRFELRSSRKSVKTLQPPDHWLPTGENLVHHPCRRHRRETNVFIADWVQ